MTAEEVACYNCEPPPSPIVTLSANTVTGQIKLINNLDIALPLEGYDIRSVPVAEHFGLDQRRRRNRSRHRLGQGGRLKRQAVARTLPPRAPAASCGHTESFHSATRSTRQSLASGSTLI